MRRKITNTELSAIAAVTAIALIVVLPIAGVIQLGNTLGWPLVIGTGVLVVIVVRTIRSACVRARTRNAAERVAARRAALFEKYGDAVIVERIMRNQVWQGQTSEQLSDALGDPEGLDERVLKSHTRQTWKYRRQGKNRFGLRIVIDDGSVVGWDEKNS